MLPRAERLRHRRDFAKVYSRKKSWANTLLVLYVRRHEANGEISETRRFGFSVSKKVGKAHDRNRVKRRLREICRAERDLLRKGFDAIFVVRTPAATVPFDELRNSVTVLLRRAGLFVRTINTDTGTGRDLDATLSGRNGSVSAEPKSDKE